MAGLGKCRRCGQPVLWRRHRVSGKAMPLDPDPVADGNVKLEEHGKVRVLGRDEIQASPGLRLYVTHFVTCPKRKQPREPDPEQLELL